MMICDSRCFHFILFIQIPIEWIAVCVCVCISVGIKRIFRSKKSNVKIDSNIIDTHTCTKRRRNFFFLPNEQTLIDLCVCLRVYIYHLTNKESVNDFKWNEWLQNRRFLFIVTKQNFIISAIHHIRKKYPHITASLFFGRLFETRWWWWWWWKSRKKTLIIIDDDHHHYIIIIIEKKSFHEINEIHPLLSNSISIEQSVHIDDRDESGTRIKKK